MINVIVATDENGKTWEYEVEVFEQDRPNEKEKVKVVSLGFPMQWYYSDIIHPPRDGDKMYIDACGRNHAGTSVWISHKELMSIVTNIISNQTEM
jgi:hypothetical protein